MYLEGAIADDEQLAIGVLKLELGYNTFRDWIAVLRL